MYLYGASGHAKVIIEILELSKIPVEGLFDDDRGITALLGYKVRQFTRQVMNSQLLISIGDNRRRKLIADQLSITYGSAIHPAATISPRVQIGEGTVVMAGVTINSGTTIGKHCIINTNASVDHDCIIHDFVHVSPNTTLCGGIEIGEGTHLGAGAVVIPGVRIGKWATIGAGSVVIRDVPDQVTVVGNPGRIIKAE